MPAAEQPFPLPLTDGGGIGFLSLFLENRCNGSNNPPTKSQVSHPVSASAPIRQTPPEGISWFSPSHPCAGALLRPLCSLSSHLAHFPYWSSHSFVSSYPSNGPGQPISQSSFMAVVGMALHPCQHPSPGISALTPSERLLTLLLCRSLENKDQRRNCANMAQARPHTKKSDFFLLLFNQSGSHCRQ